MPPELDSPYPGGMTDSSPTFQRWVRECGSAQVPKGRLESCAIRQPSLRDLACCGCWFPTLKRWAIIACPSGTETWPSIAGILWDQPPVSSGEDPCAALCYWRWRRGACGIPALTALQRLGTIRLAMYYTRQEGKMIPGVRWLAVPDRAGEFTFGTTLSLRKQSRRANFLPASKTLGLWTLSLHQ
jgi:hypothetical protein